MDKEEKSGYNSYVISRKMETSTDSILLGVVIYLNFKSEYTIEEQIAHEVAHLLEGDFEDNMKRVLKVLNNLKSKV